MDFVISIDTEADNQWEPGCDITLKNIKFIPRFQNLCSKYRIRPTYLVTSEVCEDDFAKEILSEYLLKNSAEVGAHLHSWTTPPFQDKDGYRFNDRNHAFASELPVHLMNEKIKVLAAQIETSFGVRPQSFRSGRYGFNENVAKCLVDNSFLVDSSVTPFTSWSTHPGIPGGIGGPDFFDQTPIPFNYHFEKGSLVEIPITILPTKFPLNVSNSLAEFYFRNVSKSIPLKVIRKLRYKNQPLWLRPHNWMSIDLFEELLVESFNRRLPVIVMMFHSSELMPGSSKNYANEAAIEKLYLLLEEFFILITRNEILSVTLSEAAKKIVL
jgi:hypothetical protein